MEICKLNSGILVAYKEIKKEYKLTTTYSSKDIIIEGTKDNESAVIFDLRNNIIMSSLISKEFFLNNIKNKIVTLKELSSNYTDKYVSVYPDGGDYYIIKDSSDIMMDTIGTYNGSQFGTAVSYNGAVIGATMKDNKVKGEYLIRNVAVDYKRTFKFIIDFLNNNANFMNKDIIRLSLKGTLDFTDYVLKYISKDRDIIIRLISNLTKWTEKLKEEDLSWSTIKDIRDSLCEFYLSELRTMPIKDKPSFCSSLIWENNFHGVTIIS